MPPNTPARICTHTHTPPHHATPCLRTLTPKQLSAFLSPGSSWPHARSSPSLPACPGHQTHKGRGRAWAGLARCHANAALGALASPCAARHLRNECHYWGPAGQAPAGPSHPGCEQSWGWGSGTRGCGDSGDASSPPWPQSSALISLEPQRQSLISHTDSQTSGSSPSSAQGRKQGTHSRSTYACPRGAKSWYCHFPLLDTAMSVHLITYCLSPLSTKGGEHLLSMYCVPCAKYTH